MTSDLSENLLHYCIAAQDVLHALPHRWDTYGINIFINTDTDNLNILLWEKCAAPWLA